MMMEENEIDENTVTKKIVSHISFASSLRDLISIVSDVSGNPLGNTIEQRGKKYMKGINQ